MHIQSDETIKPIDLAEILDHVPAVVFRLAHVGDCWRVLYASQAVTRYGYTAEEFMDGTTAWFSLVHPDDRVTVSKSVQDYEAHKIDEYHLYYRLVTKSGECVPITEYNTVNRDANGDVVSYDTSIVNNAMPVASEMLLDNHYRQQMVFNDILISLLDADLDRALQIILDRTGAYLDTSRALLFKEGADRKTCKVIYEWNNSGIPSVMDLDYCVTYETAMPEIYVALQNTGSLLINYGEIPENCKEEFEAEGLVASAIFAVYLNGEHYGFVCFDDCVIERVWDEDTVRFLKNVSNVISNVIARQHAGSRLMESQRTIEYMALKDHLTSLGNRMSCDVALRNAIADAKRDGTMGYVVFMDMDDFKVVNDCYGHDYGDAILISLAGWLQDTFSEQHQVFRFGGDEFVLLTTPGVEVDIEEMLCSMHERATQPWEALDKEFYCTLSIGVVPYTGNDGMDSLTAIKQADIAMYEAKRQGKNRHKVYEGSFDEFTVQRSRTEALLRSAMENDFAGFEILYQPIVDAQNTRILGAEALLRMRDGDRIVRPDEFLSLAEYLGFIIPIGEHVLQQAALECKKINNAGLPDFKITVNLSGKQMQQTKILQRLDDILEETGVDYDNVIIAISERVALENPERMKLVCNQLKDRGISITLDDFGGGSASFLLFQELPVDTITTTTTLLMNIDDQFSREFIELIIRLCASLGKQVCVNGIENLQHFDYCQGCGADLLQGFYLYTAQNIQGLWDLL